MTIKIEERRAQKAILMKIASRNSDHKPGDVIKQFLGASGRSKRPQASERQLQVWTRLPRATLDRIFRGRVPITPTINRHFKGVLSTPGDFLIRAEREYRHRLAATNQPRPH